MGINKVQYGNTVLIDLTDTTAVASDVAAGKYFYGKDGVKTLGTGSGGGGSITVEALSVTQNGTYTAQTGHAYSPVTVNVSGGASAWTKVAETSYQVSTTSTSTTTVATWSTGYSEIWDEDKILYIRIRDTAGKRAGYFYGTDTFFMNFSLANSSSSTSAINGAVGNIWRCNTSGNYEQRYSYGTTNYGVYCDQVYSDGRIRIRKRYNSNYTLTIDGTYKVEVYLLDPAGGIPIFE